MPEGFYQPIIAAETDPPVGEGLDPPETEKPSITPCHCEMSAHTGLAIRIPFWVIDN